MPRGSYPVFVTIVVCQNKCIYIQYSTLKKIILILLQNGNLDKIDFNKIIFSKKKLTSTPIKDKYMIELMNLLVY